MKERFKDVVNATVASYVLNGKDAGLTSVFVQLIVEFECVASGSLTPSMRVVVLPSAKVMRKNTHKAQMNILR